MFKWLRNSLSIKAPLQGNGSMVQTINAMQEAPARGSAEIIAAFSDSPWLHQVLQQISYAVSSVAWELYYIKGKSGKAKHVAALQGATHDAREKILSRYKSSGDMVAIDSHPLLSLLENPNKSMSGNQMLALSQKHLDLIGESFWIIDTNEIGVPQQLWPIPPTWVTKIPTANKNTFEININGGRVNLPADRAVWMRHLNPSDPFGRGVGTGMSIADELDTDEYAAETAKRFFYNRAEPSMLVSIEGASEEALKRVAAQWENNHRGFAKSFRPHFYSGKMTVQQLMQSIDDTKLLELRTWERESFRTVYGVPPEICGITGNSNRAAITQAIRIFTLMVVIPRLEFLRSCLQSQLVPLYDDRLVIDYVSPMPVDEDLQLEYARVASWAMTRRELRERIGVLDRGEVDEVHMVPFGLYQQSPEGDVLLSSEQPQTLQLSDMYQRKISGCCGTSKASHIHTKGIAVVETILNALRPDRLTVELDPLWLESVDEWGSKVLDKLNAAVSFNMLNPLVKDHLQEFSSTRINGLVNETTREVLRSQLVEGFQAGESIRDLTKRVKTVFTDASERRAKNIAISEVNRSSNFATTQAHIISGVVTKRSWVATISDDRTRDEHLALNGQVVGINEPFVIGHMQAMYPGDFGIASMDCGCRCTTVAEIENPKSIAELAEVWKDYDAKVRPWEGKAKAALRRGFMAQQEDIIEAIDRLLA